MSEIREYHKNGFLKSIYSVDENNIKNGLNKEYWPDGRLIWICYYENGFKLDPMLIMEYYGSRSDRGRYKRI